MSRKWVPVLVALVALVGGVAWASIPDPGGVIHGCYEKNGNLRVIDLAAPKQNDASCKNNETALDWNQAGPAGASGAAGAMGASGPKGDSGAAGASGPKGDSGADGATGAMGASGPKGDSGAAGASGPKGDSGAAGLTGAMGASGPKGDSGAAGASGPKGDSGATGATGPSGARGASGATGAPGAGISVGAVVAPNGAPQYASQGVTVTRTSAGTYKIDIAAGIFTSAAVPVITPVGGAFVSGLSGDLISTFTVNFSADTGFSVLITQVRP